MLRYIFILSVMIGSSLAAFAVEEVQIPVRVVEVGEIHVSLSSREGQITALDCSRCPITLSVNERTRFFAGNKEVDRDKVAVYSGKGGTVSFTREMLAVKTVWYIDSQD